MSNFLDSTLVSFKESSLIEEPEEIVSSKTLSIINFALSSDELPLADDVSIYLAYLPDLQKIFCKVLIVRLSYELKYYLECSKDTIKRLQLPNTPQSSDLDKMISSHDIAVHFANGLHTSLDCELVITDANNYVCIHSVAMSEELIDFMFMENPGLRDLKETLHGFTEFQLISDIKASIHLGHLNPARELMLNRKDDLGICPPLVREKLVQELFTKREIPWS